jgi:Toprim-like
LDNSAELEQFKRQLKISTYAATVGYTRDTLKSSSRVAVLRRGSDDDKLLVWEGRDGYEVYQSDRDEEDSGSVIDFVMRREGLNLGQARMALRKFLGTLKPLDTSSHSCPSVKPPDHEPDRKKVVAVWSAARWTTEVPYLAGRGLSAETLGDPRFLDTFRLSATGAVVFPHRDRFGLCGYEVRRSDGFRAMGKNTVKGLWHSTNLGSATAIVVCESPIDCMSHHQLYGWNCAYVSLGGTIGTRQRDLLTGLLAKANARHAMVIVGTDNDTAGEGYFDELSLLAPVKLKRHRPIGKDWSDDLAYVNRENG